MGWSESDSGSVRYRPNQTIFIPENTTLYAVWEKIEAPSNDPIYDFDVKIQCISDSNHHDYETSPRYSCETTFGSVYYSEEKKLYLCDMTINAKDIINRYYFQDGKRHDFYPDPNISTKVITLYYDENEISNYRKWKKLDEPGNPVIFKVTCANENLGYRVNHEYYKRDKDNKLILEDVIRSEVEQNIRVGTKVGISNEKEKVDIEVTKIFEHTVDGKKNIYDYFENSGNIVIEENRLKEITLRYVRDEGIEKVLIKAEKIWEDNNNKYGKRPQNIILQVKDKEKIVEERVVNENNNWCYEFVLLKYDESGNQIEYTVDEKETSEFYEKTVDGYTVINKYIDKNSNDNKDEIIENKDNVNTSDINIFVYVLIFFVAVIVIIVGTIFVKKNK